jgi:formylmethanofuran dehydrogenase subunit E
MKTTKTVLTKLDGLQEVELWSKDEFGGRDTKIYTGEIDNMTLVNVIPIPDTLIVCDFCNEDIIEFPVPVIFHHALCPKCYQEVLA